MRMFSVIEYSSFFAVRHNPTMQERPMGDGVDAVFDEEGHALRPGEEWFRSEWEDRLNADEQETLEAYFPEIAENESLLETAWRLITIPDDVPSAYHERFMDFWRGYTQAVGFTSTVDDEDGQGGQLFEGGGDFDSNYPDAWDEYAPYLSDHEREEMLADAVSFFMEAKDLIDGDDNLAGSDFHFTRNGHGSGFTDGDWHDCGNELAAMSKPYGSLELYGTLNEHGEIESAYLCH